jgi:hypothetical protein
MKRFLSISLAVFCCFCLFVASEHRAYAYVDPGSGLLAIQSMFAALGAAGYFLRRRLAGIFGRKKPMAEVVEAPVQPSVIQTSKTRSAA